MITKTIKMHGTVSCIYAMARYFYCNQILMPKAWLHDNTTRRLSRQVKSLPHGGLCVPMFQEMKRKHSTSTDSLKDQDGGSTENTEVLLSEKCEGKSTGLTKRGRPQHIPVLLKETLSLLQPQNGQTLVDMTFGAGGHAREILTCAPDVTYVAADRDVLAHNLAQDFAKKYSNVRPVHSKFSQLLSALTDLGIAPGTVDGFLFDLGASSMQFDTADRGFSLSMNGPLDMRMDGDRDSDTDSITAADVVNKLESHDLAHILKKYGEERRSKEVAQAIVEARYAFGNFTHTRQLADVVQAVFNNSFSAGMQHDKMFRQAHVATRTFQALRIFVNNELNELNNGLELARYFLRPGGRCVVISFHSLEDRIVKRHFHGIDLDEASNMSIHQHLRNSSITYDIDQIKEECLKKPWNPLSRKVIETSQREMAMNPRSRSAKLRGAIKV